MTILEKNIRRKRKHNNITYTTGDIQKNIDHFNKMLTGKATNTHTDGLPNTGLQREAELAAKNIGTISAQSPDGSAFVSSSSAGGEGSGDGGSTGSAAGGMSESYILPED